MCSPYGRVASRDTTVPDSTWHGVSGRGALAETPPAAACLRTQVPLGVPGATVLAFCAGSPTFSVWLKLLDPLISATPESCAEVSIGSLGRMCRA
jgi:hypothetical protein